MSNQLLAKGSAVNSQADGSLPGALPFGSDMPRPKTKPRPAVERAPSEVGLRVARALEHADMSQNELARRLAELGALGTGASGYVSRLVSGDRGGKRGPSGDLLRAIAEVCGVDAGWLAFGQGSPPSAVHRRKPS
jgi:hypothetical protein